MFDQANPEIPESGVFQPPFESSRLMSLMQKSFDELHSLGSHAGGHLEHVKFA